MTGGWQWEDTGAIFRSEVVDSDQRTKMAILASQLHYTDVKLKQVTAIAVQGARGWLELESRVREIAMRADQAIIDARTAFPETARVALEKLAELADEMRALVSPGP